MTVPAILGLDIGGANLKADSLAGVTRTFPFELWRRPAELGRALDELFASMPGFTILALTMTAELCDCFETKREGVARVLDSLEKTRGVRGAKIRVWQTDGRFVDPATARARPFQTAAANWLALAQWAGRLAPRGPALLIDVGSTTADLIPLRDGRPVPAGLTDSERLASGALVYSGARRTPVCALVEELPYRGQSCGVAAEWFATTLDVYLTLGDLAEDLDDCRTADGRPASRLNARDRLARMVGADRECFDLADARTLAEIVADAQYARLVRAAERVSERLGAAPETVILAGSGEFLARRVAARFAAFSIRGISLEDTIGRERSKAACAHAVAILAAEERSDGD